MHRLSVVQALSLWMLLEDALHGCASYGRDVAEIYVFQLMSSNPRAEKDRRPGEHTRRLRATSAIVEAEGMAAYLDASQTLHDLLVHFAEERRAIVEIESWQNGAWAFVRLGAWMKEVEETHRWHVRVRAQGA
jgi:hypothetical protein